MTSLQSRRGFIVAIALLALTILSLHGLWDGAGLVSNPQSRLALSVAKEADAAEPPSRAEMQRSYGGFADIASNRPYSPLAPVASIPSNWQSLGPKGMVDAGFNSAYEPSIGRVNCIAADPTNPNKLYLGAGSGGVWTSTDGGQNWTPRGDQLPVLGVSDIKVDQVSTNTIYLATGDADGFVTPSVGVYKSTDGGQTWNATGLTFAATDGKQIYKLAVDPTVAGKVYAATSDGIYITANGGSTWTLSQPQSGFTLVFQDVKLRPGTPSTVYAASFNRFYRSTDSGTTWTFISSGLPAASTVARPLLAVSAAN
jgi:photosystem II stability/assembly factor-like uncharacterized protein